MSQNSRQSRPVLPAIPHDVLFEFRHVGQILRVTAIDAKTGTEVICIADPRHSKPSIKLHAARKLAYVLAKKQKNGGKLLK